MSRKRIFVKRVANEHAVQPQGKINRQNKQGIHAQRWRDGLKNPKTGNVLATEEIENWLKRAWCEAQCKKYKRQTPLRKKPAAHRKKNSHATIAGQLAGTHENNDITEQDIERHVKKEIRNEPYWQKLVDPHSGKALTKKQREQKMTGMMRWRWFGMQSAQHSKRQQRQLSQRGMRTRKNFTPLVAPPATEQELPVLNVQDVSQVLSGAVPSSRAATASPRFQALLKMLERESKNNAVAPSEKNPTTCANHPNAFFTVSPPNKMRCNNVAAGSDDNVNLEGAADIRESLQEVYNMVTLWCSH